LPSENLGGGKEKVFILYDPLKQQKPVKVWLDSMNEIEPECLQQIINLANLPFIHQWVALMPDVHAGYGMPIGGIIATEGVVIPNAVGVDIGCGVAFCETNIRQDRLDGEILNSLVGQIMRNIPTGFEHHKKKQASRVLDYFIAAHNLDKEPKELVNELDRGYYQMGTLGGGNHFVEWQEDEAGMICLMIHSGSRNFGLKIANYFNNCAVELNKKSLPQVPKEYQLAYLPDESKEGKSYLSWMNLALEFALENRKQMMSAAQEEFVRMFPDAEFTVEINAHHNYCAREEHYEKKVWVHRKGAIRVGVGEKGIIPGAMGSYSYIVEGLGNPESFFSCSHGAGRKMSRKQAKREFSVEKTINDLKAMGVVLGKRHKADVSEESPNAYKNIDDVIAKESDLVKPVKKLKTLAVIKG
jgi:tRNA-splicing ligase RtcB